MRNDMDPVPLVDPVRKFILFTNGKCGGTTLKTWFFSNLDISRLERQPLQSARIFGPTFALRHLLRGRRVAPRGAALQDIDTIRRFTNHYRKSYCIDALATEKTHAFFNFAVVRHPEDRVVSGYVDKICGEDRDEPWVREVVERGGRDGAISFNGFLDYLESVEEERCDPHWRRQSYIFGERRMDAFVRLETLSEDFARIASRVGDAHLAVFEAKRQSCRYDPAAWAAAMDFDMPDRSSQEVMAWVARHGAFPPKEAFLTDTVRARIRRIYARDFEVLPYA